MRTGRAQVSLFPGTHDAGIKISVQPNGSPAMVTAVFGFDSHLFPGANPFIINQQFATGNIYKHSASPLHVNPDAESIIPVIELFLSVGWLRV